MRFERRDRLGQGSAGVVHRAYDTELGCEVAVKTLLDVAPATAERLKQEFRALRGVTHPGLVQLYDLIVGDEACYSMELVLGDDIAQHVRGDLPAGAPLDPAADTRLRHAFLQLADAIDALHVAGRVHRDLKPPNVVVTDAGRVVVLDYGLVALLREEGAVRERHGMTGTLQYMAPEQVWGRDPAPSLDWYAVGVLLFECLTGQSAFSGTPIAILDRKQQGPAPSPGAIVPGVRADLDDLVQSLLDPSPLRRPNGDAIRATLAGARVVADRRSSLRSPFVGREAELRTLERWLAAVAPERPFVGHVVGPSGIGKSALVARFTSAAGDALVLQNRCSPHETVPFKALDGIVAGIAGVLEPHHAALASIDPADLDALGSMFPVLEDALGERRLNTSPVSPSPRELRRRGFAALRSLVAGLALRRRLVLVVEDAQWGDRDGAAALLEVLRGPEAPGVLLVLSYRDDEAADSVLLEELERGELLPDERLVLTPLDAACSRSLAGALAGGVDAGVLERIVEQAAGSPFFVEQLARWVAASGAAAPAATLDDAILGRVATVGPGARAVAELVAVAGGALDVSDVLAVAGETTATPVVYRMREQCMLRDAVTRPHGVEVYHDRIRDTLLAAIPADRRRLLHGAVASRLRARADADPEAVLEHLLGAGKTVEAGEIAVVAADRSAAALAFARAAELFELALRLGGIAGGAWRLRARHAEALANAGLGVDAGRIYETAALDAASAGASDGDVLGLRAAAARELLCAGHFDEGVQVLKRILAAVGLRYPRTPAVAIARLLGARARLAVGGLRYVARTEDAIPPDTLARVDTCWAATIGLNAFDAIRSATYQSRHTLLALDAGETGRIVRALTAEAVYRAAEGGAGGRAKADAIRLEVESLAARTGDPRARGFARLCAGVARYFAGEWTLAIGELTEAECLFRELHGVAWELDNCRLYRMWALAWMGETDALAREQAEALADAHARGDVLAGIAAASGHANLGWLAADRPLEARARARTAIERFPPRRFQSPHYADLLAQTRIDLYEGAAWSGWARFAGALPELRRRRLHRFQLLRIEIETLSASCALAAATAPGATPDALSRWTLARLVRVAAASAARLQREDLPLGRALGRTLAGAVSAVGGSRRAAASELSAGAASLEHAGAALYAEAALRMAASLLDRAAPATGAGRTIVAPDRLAAMLVPGRRERAALLSVA